MSFLLRIIAHVFFYNALTTMMLSAIKKSFQKTIHCTKRSLLGLPGGKNHPMYAQVEAAGKEQGMTLVDGKGNDPDTLGKRLVYVMDSNKFPFYQAEVCK